MRAIGGFLAAMLVVLGSMSAADVRAEGATWHGLVFETLTSEAAEKHGLLVFEGALITKVAPDSPARDQLRSGDVVISANRRRVKDADELRAALADVGGGRILDIVRMRKTTVQRLSLVHRTAVAVTTASWAGKRPTLMLDTGGHMAKIDEITFTPDGKQLVSVGYDKVIRIWDVATGKTVRTIRGQVAPGDPGKIYALAISPDGRWLAAGGWMKERGVKGHHIRLYDFVSGELVRLLKGHSNVLLDLAFGPSGRRLISGSTDKTAIVWEAPLGSAGRPDWRRGRLKRRLKGHKDYVNTVGFLPGGERVVTGAYDKTLRVWRVSNGASLGRLSGHGNQIFTLAVAPGGTIASGDKSGEIRLWSPAIVNGLSGNVVASNSRLLSAAGRRGIGSLKFNNAGRLLLATSSTGRGRRKNRIWDIVTGKVVAEHVSHDNIVLAGAWSPDGRWVATAGGDDRAIRLWSPKTGKIRRSAAGRPTVLGGFGRAVRATAVASDGGWIGWGNRWRRRKGGSGHSSELGSPIQYALALPTRNRGLSAPIRIRSNGPAADIAWRRARARTSNWALSHRRGGRRNMKDAVLDVREGDVVRATITRQPSNGYRHRSYSFTPDRRVIVSGASNGVLESYRRNGRKIGEFLGHDGAIWAVTPSPDGRFLVSGSADQTVRLWNLKTRELIVTLYHAPRGKGEVGDWVMWTPQGFYTGSPGGGRLVGWQINNGPGKAADYVTGGQLRKTLNRKDIIEEAIRLASAKAAVRRLAPGHDLVGVLASIPPELTLVTPDPHSTEFRGSKTVTAFVKAGRNTVERYDIAVNGNKVRTERVAVPANHPPPPAGQTVAAFLVPLSNGENDVEIRAFSAAGESLPIKLRIRQNGEGPLDKRGMLHVLAIGVDAYPGLGRSCGSNNDATCDLTYAGKDAKLFAETIKRELGPRHRQGVKLRILTNDRGPADQPTAANIIKAIDAAVSDGPIDTVVVFIAGHGETGRDGNYYFLPTDIARDGGINAVGQGRNILNWSQIQSRLAKSLGRTLIFLDACQSGAVGAQRAYNARLLEDARYENFVAFMAAGPNQAAIERPDVGHGLFTHALSQGMAGKASRPGERTVRVTPLGSYIAEQVRQLSSGLQVPVFSSHRDFVLVAK